MKTRSLLALGLVFSLFCGVAAFAAEAPADNTTAQASKKEKKHGKKASVKKHKRNAEAATPATPAAKS